MPSAGLARQRTYQAGVGVGQAVAAAARAGAATARPAPPCPAHPGQQTTPTPSQSPSAPPTSAPKTLATPTPADASRVCAARPRRPQVPALGSARECGGARGAHLLGDGGAGLGAGEAAASLAEALDCVRDPALLQPRGHLSRRGRQNRCQPWGKVWRLSQMKKRDLSVQRGWPGGRHKVLARAQPGRH